jgi:hypothetical protein
MKQNQKFMFSGPNRKQLIQSSKANIAKRTNYDNSDESKFPIIDQTSVFYKNCKRNRKVEAKICQVCPFRKGIESQEYSINITNIIEDSPE